jgi:hypothetical protein
MFKLVYTEFVSSDFWEQQGTTTAIWYIAHQYFSFMLVLCDASYGATQANFN